MDSDFQSKLQSVLSNPEALAKISAIASSMGEAPKIQPQENASDSPENISIPQNSFVSDPRLQLLNTLKPLIREDKRDRIDSIARAITVASMMKSFRK